jgi:hypothetical protein
MNNHDHLLKIVIKKEEDYEPFGNVVRWENESQNYPDCSMGCKYFNKLSGDTGFDWGVCSNPQSHRCSLLTFEHQGCRKFE